MRWLQSADALADMVLMFQKEVVDRLVAVPRTKDYGRLSVLAQHVCEVRRLFDVAPSAFVPPPKVTSSVAHLTPRPAGDRLADLAPLERVTAAAFGQRRKMLRGSLAEPVLRSGRHAGRPRAFADRPGRGAGCRRFRALGGGLDK